MAVTNWDGKNPLDPALFKPGAISPEILGFNEMLAELTASLPKCWEMGAQAYRDLRAQGGGRDGTQSLIRALAGLSNVDLQHW